MVGTADGKKHNIGLSLKFEGKGLKVLGYSRKLERGWEFSDVAMRLIEEYKVSTPPSSVIAHSTRSLTCSLPLGSLSKPSLTCSRLSTPATIVSASPLVLDPWHLSDHLSLFHFRFCRHPPGD